VSLPAITVPDLSLPVGGFTAFAAPTTSSPLTVGVGALTDRVQFKPLTAGSPGTAAAPGTATPGTATPGTAAPSTAAARTLPSTGTSALLAGLALALLGGGLVLRRRAVGEVEL
jgi:LPXTG-motif cell wall-anchored protein